MTPLFKKLNYKEQEEICIINAPKSFENEIAEMSKVSQIITDLKKVKTIDFVMVFATLQKEIDASIKAIVPKLKGDAVVWYCYPKGTSKRYTCEFNRDTGWQLIGDLDLEPVRAVAIDEDWSALRFRHTIYIKKITRSESMALSKSAKERTSNKSK